MGDTRWLEWLEEALWDCPPARGGTRNVVAEPCAQWVSV